MSPPRSKFGPEVRAKILARIEIGVSYTDAATAAGVKPATAKSWLGKGRREKKARTPSSRRPSRARARQPRTGRRR